MFGRRSKLTRQDMLDACRTARKGERAWIVEHLRMCGLHVAADEVEAMRFVWEDPTAAPARARERHDSAPSAGLNGP